ncbi:glycine-rich domain-containing protein [Methylomonas sp. HW2-6]|uniref:glycine-rich domain-containing protein n=1 Tax=Methylomonas sp. HW2-6 TaxID=3376687 RepID=UPI0040438B50
MGKALRQFFRAYLESDCQFVSMPSQLVDDLWHEFILYTREYRRFCFRAFGSFMHHTPAITLGKDRKDNTGLRRVWFYACELEKIKPRHPVRLPLLFAIDQQFNIANGFFYTLDCQALQNGDGAENFAPLHCGGDFYSTDFDGSIDGIADASGDGGGDGDGGGGCGGGGD